MSGFRPLGVYFGWHVHPWEDLLAAVQHAEALGYSAAFVDGDISMLERRQYADCLHGWTTTTALLALTKKIQIGSMRLVHHWNAAALAQAVATSERIFPKRLRFQIAIGDWEIDADFGIPLPPAADRIAWLDETLDALRALLHGDSVTRSGRFVTLRGARVRPVPPGGRMPITVAAQSPRTLDVVARHADVWEINLPPIAERVVRLEETLASACARHGRDPRKIERTMLLFARPGATPESALAEFRRLSPWFASIPDAEARAALIVGPPEACRERIERLRQEFRLALPIVDLSGVALGPARSLLEALAPAA